MSHHTTLNDVVLNMENISQICITANNGIAYKDKKNVWRIYPFHKTSLIKIDDNNWYILDRNERVYFFRNGEEVTKGIEAYYRIYIEKGHINTWLYMDKFDYWHIMHLGRDLTQEWELKLKKIRFREDGNLDYLEIVPYDFRDPGNPDNKWKTFEIKEKINW